MAMEDDLVPTKSKPTRSSVAYALLFVLIFTNAMGKSAMFVEMPFNLIDFGASPVIVGLVQTIIGAMGIAGTLLFGPLSDRIGRKITGLPCFAATIFLQGATLLAPGLWQLICIQALYFFFSSGARATFVVFISDMVDPSGLPTALGYLTVFDSLGQFMGCALNGAFGDCGYPCVASVASGAILVTLPIAYLALPDKEPETGMEEALLRVLAGAPMPEEEEDEPMLESFKGLMRKTRFRQLVLLHMVINLGYCMFLSCIALLFHDLYGLGADGLGQVSVQAGFFVLIVQLFLLRKIVEFLSESAIVVFGLICRIVGAVVLAAWIHPSAPVTSMSIISVGTSVLEPCLMSLAISTTPITKRGAALSTYKTATLIGESFGPLVAASMYAARHSLPFYSAAVLAGVSVLGMLWSDRCLQLAGEEAAPADEEMDSMNPMMAHTMTMKGRRKTAAAYLLLTDMPTTQQLGGKYTTFMGPRQDGGPRRRSMPEMGGGRRKLSMWQGGRTSSKSKSCAV